MSKIILETDFFELFDGQPDRGDFRDIDTITAELKVINAYIKALPSEEQKKKRFVRIKNVASFNQNSLPADDNYWGWFLLAKKRREGAVIS